jgi:hypothetical protein
MKCLMNESKDCSSYEARFTSFYFERLLVYVIGTWAVSMYLFKNVLWNKVVTKIWEMVKRLYNYWHLPLYML